MNKFIKSFIAAAALSAALISCSKDDNSYDYPQFGAYVTVNAADNTYYFTGDDGETYYPGDISRIGHYSSKDKNGKRAYIYFNILPEKEEGYDYNVAMYGVVDILSKSVETADTDEKLKEFGDDRLSIEKARIIGDWLDIEFSLWSDYGSTHKMTLLDNKTVAAPADMPADYQYLEFRQLGDNRVDIYRGYGNVSYDLGEYAPSATGKKGLYIRIRNLHGNIEYVTVKYTAPDSGEGGDGGDGGDGGGDQGGEPASRIGAPVGAQEWAM